MQTMWPLLLLHSNHKTETICKQERRLLLTSVSRSVTLYAASIWADAMKIKSYARGIHSTHRVCPLRVCCAFRTVLDDAAVVIAGMPPIDLLAAEKKPVDAATRAGHLKKRARLYARPTSLTSWQLRFHSSSKGRWTHRLLQNITRGIEHGSVNFHLTQLLRGHGCFRQYLHRFGHESSPLCTWCGGETIEDTEHAIFRCGRLGTYRHRLKEAAGREITPSNLVNLMIDNNEFWEEVCLRPTSCKS